MQRHRMTDCHVLTHRHAIGIFHAVQHTAILNARIGADADGINVAAHHCVHPDGCMLAEDNITNDLRRLIHITACRNCRVHSLKRSNHSSLPGQTAHRRWSNPLEDKNKYYQHPLGHRLKMRDRESVPPSVHPESLPSALPSAKLALSPKTAEDSQRELFMGRIHVLSKQVANKIAAGEVVERPASVVKELLENALDAGATRIKISVEAGGKKLIQITDNGCGMVRDDAMLAFERHATSKIKDTDDLLRIATLGFRGEALPSIASVARLHLETRAEEEAAGTVIEINGGKMIRVDEAGLPLGTSITIRDLFFNIPARKKFLRSESTELSHIASLVTHYALAHPKKHFELHSSTNALLVAPPVDGHRERVYQVFGKETLDQLIPPAAVQPLEGVGLPQPPPWRRDPDDEPEKREPGEMRLHGFVSKPEIQKLNRNSIYIFVNERLIRDRLIQHALTEAYRNILPPSVFPVVLLFIEMPAAEVDVNVHPSKTEVRFRQQTVIHDFVRDAVREALMKARPVPQFLSEIKAQPTATPGLTSGVLLSAGAQQAPGRNSYDPNLYDPTQPTGGEPIGANGEKDGRSGGATGFALRAPAIPPVTARLEFDGGIAIEANAAVSLARHPEARAPEN